MKDIFYLRQFDLIHKTFCKPFRINKTLDLTTILLKHNKNIDLMIPSPFYLIWLLLSLLFQRVIINKIYLQVIFRSNFLCICTLQILQITKQKRKRNQSSAKNIFASSMSKLYSILPGFLLIRYGRLFCVITTKNRTFFADFSFFVLLRAWVYLLLHSQTSEP